MKFFIVDCGDGFIFFLGLKGTVDFIVSGALDKIPGVKSAISGEIEKEVEKSVKEMFKEDEQSGLPVQHELPKQGSPHRERRIQ